MDTSTVGEVLLFLPLLLISVIVHEVSHGLVAYWCGDPTAKYAGRLTLNPIPHIDPYGSIILPALLMLFHSPVRIGWAKPVPVDAHNFRHSYDGILVAAAGPVSNVLLGSLFAIGHVASFVVPASLQMPMRTIADGGLGLNCVLAVFNLIPIPPLDGHWVLLRFLPPSLARPYAQMGTLGIVLIFLLLMIPGVGQTVIGVPVTFLENALIRLALIPFGGLAS